MPPRRQPIDFQNDPVALHIGQVLIELIPIIFMYLLSRFVNIWRWIRGIGIGDQPKIVHFNVGGTVFSTETDTVDACPFLNGLIEENESKRLIKAGKSILIDANPKVFEHILEYLRYGDNMILPTDQWLLRKLKQDATDFYDLAELADLVQSKLTNTIVNLNVGGIRYSTSLATLQKCPKESKLITLIKKQIDSDQEIFVDRNGTVFRYILEYLRNGKVTLPCDQEILAELVVEAKEYGLKELEELIAAWQKQMKIGDRVRLTNINWRQMMAVCKDQDRLEASLRDLSKSNQQANQSDSTNKANQQASQSDFKTNHPNQWTGIIEMIEDACAIVKFHHLNNVYTVHVPIENLKRL